MITYRDDEVGPDHPLLALLGALAGDPSVRRRHLAAQALRFADGAPERHRAQLLESYAEACAGVDRGAAANTASAAALECWRRAGDCTWEPRPAMLFGRCWLR